MERYGQTNLQKRECPKVCPGEDVEDGQLKTGEQLRFACLHTRLRAWLDHEMREYCILLFFFIKQGLAILQRGVGEGICPNQSSKVQLPEGLSGEDVEASI